MGKAKSESVEPGAGGYQVAVYKNSDLKKVLPLGQEAYGYVKSKFKKHGVSAGLQPQHKEIQKPSAKKKMKPEPAASSQAPIAAASGSDKPKRKLTATQWENLRKGREQCAA